MPLAAIVPFDGHTPDKVTTTTVVSLLVFAHHAGHQFAVAPTQHIFP